MSKINQPQAPAGRYNGVTMNAQQLETVASIATLALALVQTIKALLEVADLLRRLWARRRGLARGTGRVGRRPRRHGKDAPAKRSAPPRRGRRRGPRPGPGRGRAPPGRRRAAAWSTPLVKLAAACVLLPRRSTGGQRQRLQAPTPQNLSFSYTFLGFLGCVSQAAA